MSHCHFPFRPRFICYRQDLSSIVMISPRESLKEPSPPQSSSLSSSAQPPPSSQLPPLSSPTSIVSPTIKNCLLAFFIIGAFLAWSLGAWDAILERTNIRPRLRPVLLLVGDSQTEKGMNPNSSGWVTMLQKNYARSANIVPRGLSGYNTKWYLKHAMPVIQDEIASGIYKPALVTIWLGANDAALPEGSSPEQHVPIEAYNENLAKIAHIFQSMTPDTSILFITPTYVDDAVEHQHAEKNSGNKKGLVAHSNEMAGNYALACVETAKKLGLPVLNLHSLFNTMPEAERNGLLADGLHLNSKGNKLVYNLLLKRIVSEFPHVSHKLEQWQFPGYDKWIEVDSWTPDLVDPSVWNFRRG